MMLSPCHLFFPDDEVAVVPAPDRAAPGCPPRCKSSLRWPKQGHSRGEQLQSRRGAGEGAGRAWPLGVLGWGAIVGAASRGRGWAVPKSPRLTRVVQREPRRRWVPRGGRKTSRPATDSHVRSSLHVVWRPPPGVSHRARGAAAARGARPFERRRRWLAPPHETTHSTLTQHSLHTHPTLTQQPLNKHSPNGSPHRGGWRAASSYIHRRRWWCFMFSSLPP